MSGYYPPDYRGMAAALDCGDADLTDWECDFVTDMYDRLSDPEFEPSDRQAEILVNLYRREIDRGNIF